MSDFDTWWQEQLEASPQVDLLRRAFAAGRASVEATPSQEPHITDDDNGCSTLKNRQRADYILNHYSRSRADIVALARDLTRYDQEKAAPSQEPDWIDVSNGCGGHRGEYDWECAKCGKIDWFARYTDPNKTGVKCSCSKTSQEPCAWMVGSQVFGNEELAGMSAKAACRNVHPLYRVPPDAAAQIAELKELNENHAFNAKYFKCEYEKAIEQIAKLEAELERERLRLAACSSAALGYFDGCKDEYKSATLDDVLQLREKCAAAEKDAARYRWLRMNRLWLKANLPAIAAMAFDAAIDDAMKLSPGDKGEKE